MEGETVDWSLPTIWTRQVLVWRTMWRLVTVSSGGVTSPR